MKNEKLLSLLYKLETYESKSDSNKSHDCKFLNDAFAIQLVGGYITNTNEVCGGNDSCHNNSVCNGNSLCRANEACGGNSGCSTNESCLNN
jgi:hypothetical protein